MRKSLFLSALTAVGFALPLMFANNEAHAFTISDNGEYALIMDLKMSDYDEGDIDGSSGKILKFNFDQGEESVKLYDLTKGVKAYNGKNEFSGWALSPNDSEPASKETLLKKDDFSSQGDCAGIKYSKGKSVYAIFNGKDLSETDEYYLKLDPFAGKVNGEGSILLSGKMNEFKTVDLSKYKAEREGCTFCGWDCNGEIVTSIDKSYFSKDNKLTVSALYKKNTFYGVDEKGRLNNTSLPENERSPSYVLILDANGGTIDGKSSNQYDYLGGKDSGTSMPIFHYIPERKGFKFKTWNTKKDGSGHDYKYMYWKNWSTEENGFDKDSLTEDGNVYRNLTLYATWEGTPIEEEPAKEISSNEKSEVKGSIEFSNSETENYQLEIKKVEVPKELSGKNVKLIADINLFSGTEIVEVNGEKMKIKLALPEDLKGYNKYEIVYIQNGEIKETLPATVENGNIVFETSHLSQYGIVATNVKENGSGEKSESKTEPKSETENKNNSSENFYENPVTGDGIACAMALFAFASIGMATFPFLKRK